MFAFAIIKTLCHFNLDQVFVVVVTEVVG